MDCGIITSKMVILFLSLIFWAAGGALVYVGSYVIKSYSNFDNFLQDKYTFIPAGIIIPTGVVMFIIGTVGCYATLSESKVGLSFFLLIILAIFAAEVTALVYGFIYQSKIKGNLERSMSAVFMKYDGENSDTQAVDYLQSQLQCCGVQTYLNWTTTPWFSSIKNTVPVSCCKENHTECTGKLDQLDLLNTLGCEGMLEKLLQDVMSYAMLVILGFSTFKVFGSLSVCVITCKVARRDGYQSLNA
ncbi:tetraspanin-36 isoform X1 [Salmo salar]|uniref:Tetraspanin n=1 Tax=Salmo salar TaxID=8030 RepID=C0H992_SALSA|nr:tetraspanin-36 isoform X1 [Salmo salar]ACN10611.1 Tetraspanin-3 [Salmo salar]|eukprot:XP_014016405.1 PREDICTED: tetraspanin-3-like isoform X1 [Salmo salar]